jgi:crotonobetainyl-CoA:carnitine CoA-transferase CaiB-like acyl-CoA transferase
MASLTGIRVLDLTRLLPGAHCTLLLADMGADVVKVEEPTRGDYMRWYPPLRDGQSVLFDALNRNKRSVAVNLKHESGRALFLRLVERADVVIEGNRPGVMDRLGLGWSVLRGANPRLVLCSLTGYGQTGPWAQRAGHDLNYMAAVGALAMNGRRGEGPHPLGVPAADLGGGAQSAAVAILAALVEVGRGGEGRHLDVAMADGALTWLASPLAQVGAGATFPRGGHRLTGRYACYDVYPCRDGWMSVAANEPKFWKALCEALGLPELIELQLVDEAQDRARAALARVFATATRAEWEERLGGLDVCCEPVRELDEVASHPQVRERGMIVETERGVEVAPPVPQGEGWRRRDAPRLGEHTAELLAEVGVGDERLAALREEGAL